MKHYQEMSQSDIESLAMSRAFADLTEAERGLVLAQLGGEEEYARMRMAIAAARDLLATEGMGMKPAPDIRASMHAAMLRRRRKTPAIAGMIGRIAGYRIPVYQPTLAVLAAIVIVFMIRPERPEPATRERIIYRTLATPVAQIDTEEIVRRVVDSLKGELERPAPTLVRTVIVRDTGRKEEAGADAGGSRSAPENGAKTREVIQQEGNRFVGLANMQQLEVQRRGRNLAEDSAGSRFMVSAAPDKF